MIDDMSRKSAAVVLSLAFHASLIAWLAGRALVQLAVTPSPVTITFVEASSRSVGPGERSAELKIAASMPPTAAAIPEPEAVEPRREKVPEPAPVVAARPKAALKKAAPLAPPTTAPDQVASIGAPSGASASSGMDSRSSAPAWAPAARVRYEELLFAWMDRHKEYPMLAQRRGLEGTGSLRIRIDREGRVLERSVARSTGEAMLDQAALDMVRRASPFPAVPAEYAGAAFEFVAPIQYRLR